MALRYFSQSESAMEIAQNIEISNILLYKTSNGESRIEVIFNSETFWMPQKRMAELYGVDVRTVNYHLTQIYESGELQESATIRKIGIVQNEGDREVNRPQMLYNLDAIIAVGYRVNSYQATQFRIWATTVLKEMIVKGFVLDDERLKQGMHFAKNYLSEKEIMKLNRLSTSFLDFAETQAENHVLMNMADWQQQFFRRIRQVQIGAGQGLSFGF